MYVELHAHSSYSFRDGASLPEELAIRAAEYGYGAFALTDHDGVWGAMEFAQACGPLGVRPIVGAELTVAERPPHDDPFHLTLLVEDATGWANLCRLITEAHADTRPIPERDPLPPVLAFDSLCERSEGLVCLTGCARDGALAGAWERGDPRLAQERAGAAAEGVRARPAAGGAPAAAVAARPGPESMAGRGRGAARGRVRGDRQRPQPRPGAGGAPGRAGGGRAAHDARGVRAGAARQLELDPGAAGGDGGAVLRTIPTRSPRPSGSPSGCASISPRSWGIGTPARRTRRPTGRWRRSAAAGSTCATRGRRSARRRPGGSPRSSR